MESKELISQRFIEAIDRLKNDSHVSSDAAFCRSISILPQTLPDIKAKKRDVTLEIIANTCNTYGLESGYFFGQTDKFYTNEDVHTNAHTLTHTLGQTQNQTVQVKYAETESKNLAEEPNNNYEPNRNKVYFIDESVRAGLVVGFTQENTKDLEPISIPWLGKGIFYVFNVRGDSMYPTLSNGDKVLAKQIMNIQYIKSGEIYVWLTDDGMVIKRYSHNELDQVILLSDNEETYAKPLLIEIKRIMGVFEVLERNTSNLGKNNTEKQQLKLYKALLESKDFKI